MCLWAPKIKQDSLLQVLWIQGSEINIPSGLFLGLEKFLPIRVALVAPSQGKNTHVIALSQQQG